MRTILYTGHDELYKPLAAITVPRMAEYAERNGWDFTCYTEPLLDAPNGIYWTGVCGAMKAFEEGYDRAIYLDVDQFVTNFDYKLPPMNVGLHIGPDWGYDAIAPWQVSMCGFVAFPSTQAMLSEVVKSEPEWRDKPFPEQNIVQDCLEGIFIAAPALVHNVEKYEGFINIHPRKVFNNVPEAVCPGKVPEPWKKGDWCAHLTMLPIYDRITLALKCI